MQKLGKFGFCLLFTLALPLGGCGDEAVAPKQCNQECLDSTALRGIRETLKLVYNLTLQGNPIGAQDESTPCPLGGRAAVSGNATSNADHGATEVALTYVLEACAYAQRDEEPEENYNLTITGSIVQQGTIAVQPTATSALIMSSEQLTLTGTVFDPPIAYQAEACALQVGQSGSNVAGTLCGRPAGVDL
jgi:hypothetical protein